MLVVHLSLSPLAGAPIRIVDALNQWTSFHCRLINFNPGLYGARTFPEDLIWAQDQDVCLELIKTADILHFHHYFDLETENNPFNINFRDRAKKSAKFIRQYHTDLFQLCQWNKCSPSAILNDRYPRIVIAHCAERTFLDTFIVPNILPIQSELLCPEVTQNRRERVFFSASFDTSMWHARWNTKGLPEVRAKFEYLQTRKDFDFLLVSNTPYEQCQKLKQQSDIVIGDTTSGGFHLTDLEALSQGKPTFTYLDGRSQMVLQQLLNCNELPFINARLDEIDAPFLTVLGDKCLREEIGQLSREWIEKYYSEQVLVTFYEEAYAKILSGEPLCRQDFFYFQKAKAFLYNTLYDLQWEERRLKQKHLTEPTSSSHQKSDFALFPNRFQKFFLTMYSPFLRVIARPKYYKLFRENPSRFFADTKHPINKAFLRFLELLDPTTRN